MSLGTAWTLLVISGLLDVAWAIATKKADGFRDPLWTVASLALLAAFVVAMTRALTVLPLGIAYVAWVGIGAVGSLIAGRLFFGEQLTPAALGFAAIALIGVAGLKWTSA